MSWQHRVYLGTWQFSGDFHSVSEQEIKTLISSAIGYGIMRFDTAAVYGNGNVELTLGKILPSDAVIVTKVPALRKPDILTTDKISGYYSPESIKKSAMESLTRLNRKSVDTILLHNWVSAWDIGNEDILEALNALKKLGLTERVGISLPDEFELRLPETLIQNIDVVEAPYNLNDSWILHDLPVLAKEGKEVLLRSLFVQGLLVKSIEERQRLVSGDCRIKSVEKVSGLKKQSSCVLLQKAWKLDTSVVLGMTTENQIRENIESLKGE